MSRYEISRQWLCSWSWTSRGFFFSAWRWRGSWSSGLAWWAVLPVFFLFRWLWGLISNSIWIWRKIFVQLLTWFNQNQPYPQLANFEYQTRTEVTIFFYIVKLCTLLNRLPQPPYWNISTWAVPSKYLDLGCTIEISQLGLYHQNISKNGNLHQHFFAHCAVNWA